MCRAGGPRCNGSGRGGGQAASARPSSTTTAEQDEAATRPGDSIPTREMADKMGAELPPDRKGWDGKQLNDRDRRFYALREAGYKGPIDQDGYPDTTSEHAATLRRMARDRGESVTW